MGYIDGDWKILRFADIHPAEEAGWVPPPGQDPDSVTYQLPCDRSKQPSTVDKNECVNAYCLFNIKDDPCEYANVASQHPDIVKQMVKRLADYQKTAVDIVKGEGCDPVVSNSSGGRA